MSAALTASQLQPPVNHTRARLFAALYSQMRYPEIEVQDEVNACVKKLDELGDNGIEMKLRFERLFTRCKAGKKR